LAVLAVYDAISVYGTEHMLDLAEGVMDLRVPVVLVIPLTLGFSLLDGDASEEAALEDESGEEEAAAETSETSKTAGAEDESGDIDEEPPDVTDRDAFFIGLGDAVMPTVLVASAAHFLDAGSLGVSFVPALNLPALMAMVGTFVGLFILLRMVFAGRAHAGLPLLNGGAIAGYLVGAVAAGVPILTALGL